MRFYLFALFVFLPVSLYANTLNLGVHNNYHNEVFKLSSNREGYSNVLPVKNCPELSSDRLKDIQRITMDIMVICNAVKKAGFAEQIKLIPYPNVTRGIQQSISGQFDMIAQSLFKADHEGIDSLLISKPVIRSGEFQVGVFTTRNRPEILKARTINDFRQLKGVTVRSWKTDHKAIIGMGVTKIALLPSRDLLAKFIQNGRADFTLSYLKEPIVTRIGGELIRIPNVKVSFAESRSFIIPSRNRRLLSIINEYIDTLRSQEQDALRKAYIHAGFITEEYDHWLDLGKN